jgi:hypothetical protein
MACAVALCTAGLGTIPGGLASPSGISGIATDAGPPAVHEQTPQEARAQDLAAIAKSMGWTVDQAAAQEDVDDAVGALGEAIGTKYRNVYVGSRLSDTPGGTPTIYVKGPASAAVRALIAKAPIAVHLVDKQPFSYDELDARSTQVAGALIAKGYRSVATGFQLGARGAIHASVERTPGLPQNAAGVVAALPAGMRGHVAVTVHDRPVVVPQSGPAMGGMWMDDDGLKECTSGFSVYLPTTGTTGVTTAAHCNSGGGSIDHISDDSGDYYRAWTLAGRHIGAPLPSSACSNPPCYSGWGDVEWGTTTDIEPASFYTSTTTTRRVTSVKTMWSLSEQTQICRYGRMSDVESCSRISSLSEPCFVFNAGGDTATKQVVLYPNGIASIGGDSGGPRYVGNQAAGSHFGDCEGGEAFTRADYYDEALGVKVRLSQTLPGRVTLYEGDKLVSTDGRFTAIMQSDGNFVVYYNGHGALWSTGTNGNSGAYVVMQADGNLVVRRSDGVALWASNTSGSGLYLTMQTDGNLVMYGPGGAYWSSGTCCH